MSQSKWIKVHILKANVRQVDKLVKDGLFPSRQNATNYLLRKGLERYEHPLMYDDFFKGTLERLDNIEATLFKLLKEREREAKKKVNL